MIGWKHHWLRDSHTICMLWLCYSREKSIRHSMYLWVPMSLFFIHLYLVCIQVILSHLGDQSGLIAMASFTHHTHSHTIPNYSPTDLLDQCLSCDKHTERHQLGIPTTSNSLTHTHTYTHTQPQTNPNPSKAPTHARRTLRHGFDASRAPNSNTTWTTNLAYIHSVNTWTTAARQTCGSPPNSLLPTRQLGRTSSKCSTQNGHP